MRARLTVGLLAALLAATLGSLPPTAARAGDRPSQGAATLPMKIRIITENRELVATLEDNATARAFAQLLPLDLTLKDYAGTEKVADLPQRLSTTGAPEGIDPAVGDLAYYAPWGNLAIFYRDFSYSSGLIRLGRIEEGIEELRRASTIRIESNHK